MLDMTHLLGQNQSADIQRFVGNVGQATEPAIQWRTWIKPRGKTMCSIVLVGSGGCGGQGAIGAAGGATGGGGGGSGAFTHIMVPMWAIPDRLFIGLNDSRNLYGTTNSYVSLIPHATASAMTAYVQDILAVAGNGTNASNSVAGSAGAAATAALMPRGWQWLKGTLAGWAGGAGGAVTAAASGGVVTFDSTAVASGGSGGGGLPSTGTNGNPGGAIQATASIIRTIAGSAGSTATDYLEQLAGGKDGGQVLPGLLLNYGGTGAASTHPTATGAGLNFCRGGNGGIGGGGGGGGARLTGSPTGNNGGDGGPAMCVITSW